MDNDSISHKLAFEMMETAIYNMLDMPIPKEKLKEKENIINRYIEESEQEELENDTSV